MREGRKSRCLFKERNAVGTSQWHNTASTAGPSGNPLHSFVLTCTRPVLHARDVIGAKTYHTHNPQSWPLSRRCTTDGWKEFTHIWACGHRNTSAASMLQTRSPCLLLNEPMSRLSELTLWLICCCFSVTSYTQLSESTCRTLPATLNTYTKQSCSSCTSVSALHF